MSQLIEQMRTNFARVAAARIAAGVWSKADESEAGAEIARLMRVNDQDALGNWSRWLARLAQSLAVSVAVPVVAAVAPSCPACQHYARPGRSDGYCAAREDLALAYGQHHPLRVLPGDNGASCACFVARAE